jgi:hypothetical protein
VSVIITIFLAVLSAIVNVGYHGRTLDVEVKGQDTSGNLYVIALCDVTFNPVLYPLSWLLGCGRFSGKFYFISTPLYGASPSGEYSPRRYWPSRYDLMEQALYSLLVHHLSFNSIFIFAVVLVAFLLHVYDLCLCIIIGALFFPLGGPISAIISFLTVLSITLFTRVKLRRNLLIELWSMLM